MDMEVADIITVNVEHLIIHFHAIPHAERLIGMEVRIC